MTDLKHKASISACSSMNGIIFKAESHPFLPNPRPILVWWFLCSDYLLANFGPVGSGCAPLQWFYSHWVVFALFHVNTKLADMKKETAYCLDTICFTKEKTPSNDWYGEKLGADFLSKHILDWKTPNGVFCSLRNRKENA